MREFTTGAIRDDNTDKLDFKGFTSERADLRFARYMHSHRKQADGNMRGSDNWKLGIPTTAYAESLYRHFKEWARLMELAKESGYEGWEPDIYPELMELAQAIRFNLQGWVHEQDKKMEAYENERRVNYERLEKAAPLDGLRTLNDPYDGPTEPKGTVEEIVPAVGSSPLGGAPAAGNDPSQMADVAEAGTADFQPMTFLRPPRTDDWGPEYETDGEAVSDAVGYQETREIPAEDHEPQSLPVTRTEPAMGRRASESWGWEGPPD